MQEVAAWRRRRPNRANITNKYRNNMSAAYDMSSAIVIVIILYYAHAVTRIEEMKS